MRVPRPVAGRDIRSLPLSPSEGFLFSRIDGAVNEHELSLITGLPADAVAAALDRLAELQAIDFGSTAPARAPASFAATERPPRTTAAPSSPRIASAADADGGRPLGRSVLERSSQTPPLYDPAELDEVVEIERDKKQRILDLFYRLDQLSHYELLGVAEVADKKQIKSAYYALAPEVHPDKYFRKSLGTYKAKIEAIFTQVTLAHDVLTNKQRRAEYDDYLSQTQRNRMMAALLDEAPRDVATVSSAVDEAVAAAVTAIASVNTGPRPIDERDGPHVVPSGRYGAAGQASAPPPASAPTSGRELERDRREALARKLGLRGTSMPPARREVSSMPPPISPRAAPRAAAETLKARYDAAIIEAKRSQIARYADLGRAALERKDYAAAANAYRITASLAPDDAAVQQTAEEAQRLAAAALADGYMKQAEYEANQDRWGEAALSYSKVCAGRPDDARAHERVAFATLRSSGNTRRAVEFARRAVELEPQVADYRITLARAYMTAGLEKSVLGEIERALELAPNDPRLKELAKELRHEAHGKAK